MTPYSTAPDSTNRGSIATTRRHKVRLAAGAIAVTLASVGLASCGESDDAAEKTTTTAEATTTTSSAALAVSDQWVRPAEDLAAKNRTAIYLTITGGAEDDALISASVPADLAGTVELHETKAEESTETTAGMGDTETTVASGGMGSGGMDSGDGGSMMTMSQVDRIEVPAGEVVELKPGGYHIMVMDLMKPLVPGDTVEVTVTCEKAGEMTFTAEVREA